MALDLLQQGVVTADQCIEWSKVLKQQGTDIFGEIRNILILGIGAAAGITILSFVLQRRSPVR